MRSITQSEARIQLIFSLWGLLFTKCFVLEFLVRHYAVPISSITYVWMLSVLMATVATAVYANMHKGERETFFGQAGIGVVLLTNSLSALFVLAALTTPAGNEAYALTGAAALLACKSALLAYRQAGNYSIWKILGWLATAGLMVGAGSPLAFLVFAIGIFALSCVPGFIRFLKLRRSV